jgi:2-haloacid dehalogenase
LLGNDDFLRYAPELFVVSVAQFRLRHFDRALMTRCHGLRLAVLSNGTAHMLSAILAHAEVTEYFEALLSAEEVGIFKPHERVYSLVTARLSLPVEHICFVSSNGWDAWSAKAFGFPVVWCNRRAQPRERLAPEPDGELSDLRELPTWISAAS